MEKPEQTIGWGALAPFGRLGRLLGFRWVFYWTLPLPYHPLLARALPFALVAWLLWLAFGGGETAWTAPMWMALVLGALLSIPFLQWMLFAFRIHLIQALMLPAALVLLGIAAVRGEEPSWLAALPILFFAGHTAAAIAGRLRFPAWEADNRAVEALARDSGPLPSLLLRGGRDAAAYILNTLGLPAIHCEDQSDTWLVQRTDDPELIAWLKEVRDMRLNIFDMQHGREQSVVFLTGERPADPKVLRPVPMQTNAFLRGHVAAVTAEAPGEPPLTYWHGTPAPLSWIPGFYFFIRLQLGGNAGFVPEIGFLPGRPRKLGKRSDQQGAYLALASAHRIDGPSPPPFVDPADLRRRVEERLDRRLEPELSALDRLIASPATWLKRPLDTLVRLPRLYAGRAAELVEALRTARDAEHVDAAILLATLISKLPEDRFRSVGDELIAVLDSKSLAARLVHDEPLDAQGRPKFEGFRMLIHVPDLYERLGDLSERARPLIEGLLKLLPHIEALQKAKAKIDAATDPPREGA